MKLITIADIKKYLDSKGFDEFYIMELYAEHVVKIFINKIWFRRKRLEREINKHIPIGVWVEVHRII